MIAALREMGRVTVEIDGRRAELVLQVPTAGFELPLLPSEGRRLGPADRVELRAIMLGGLIQSIDGNAPSEDQRLALAAHPQSATALLELRRELHERVRHEGRVGLACPRCSTESELDLVSLMVLLGPEPWPVVDADDEPNIPSLSTLRVRAALSSSIPHAKGARLIFPSTRMGLARPASDALLARSLDAEQDAIGWRRWGQEDKPFDLHRAHWRWGNPGFRAMLRMALVLARLDETGDVDPERIARLPVTDFRFADAVHHYLRWVEVRDPERASVPCGACGERFLPVLRN